MTNPETAPLVREQPEEFIKRCPDRGAYLQELSMYKGLEGKKFVPQLIAANEQDLTLRLGHVGSSLHHLVVYEGVKMTIPDICDVVRGVTRGLSELHAAGMCHYDVTPGNICVNGTFADVKLVDFGLGFLLDSIPAIYKDQRVGTLRCCSPEHLSCSPHFGREADVFSAGVALLEVIEGGMPILDPSFGPIESQMRGIRDLVPEKTHWGEPVPRDLSLLLKAMLHFDPEERPSASICYKLALGL